MDGLISVNGKITSPDQAVIPAMDRGFLFGDNVFEVFVAFGGTLLDEAAHLARLRRSAEVHNIPVPWTDDELLFEMKSLLGAQNYPKGYVRLVVTRGSGLGLSTTAELTPNKAVFCMPARLEQTAVYQDGLRVMRKQSGLIERGEAAKTGNYIRSITALDQARRSGFDEILWTNTESEITEASTANIFFIGREGDLVEIATPPATSGLLLGITRMRIMELLRNARINVTERVITVEELPRFDEAFVCSTVRGLVPIAVIDKHQLHTTRKTAVFHHINRLFMTWVHTQIGHPVDWNSGQAAGE